jgi:hypothetical protein
VLALAILIISGCAAADPLWFRQAGESNGESRLPKFMIAHMTHGDKMESVKRMRI